MNRYLIFRTDRIGDFLVSAILLRAIKKNDPKSHITIISSSRNYSYIKGFKDIDEVLLLKNSFFKKLKLIFNLRKNKFENIIIHDGKNRSKFISFFLRCTNKIYIKNTEKLTHIQIIKEILKKMNFNFYEDSLNATNYKNEKNLTEEDYIQLHFDEKWIHNDYIRKFVCIEPVKNELLQFIEKILKKTKKKLIITSGFKTPYLLKEIISEIDKSKVKIIKNINFSDLEILTSRSSTLISCHGAISHIATSFNIKQIDIIDKSYNYKKWTNHFRNYEYLYRDKFSILSDNIINKL